MNAIRLAQIKEMSKADSTLAAGFAGLSVDEADELFKEIERLQNVCKLALPWLIRLGDFIGNGDKDKPNGRCEAVLAVREVVDDYAGCGYYCSEEHGHVDHAL